MPPLIEDVVAAFCWLTILSVVTLFGAAVVP
jgi:hypothetical protein